MVELPPLERAVGSSSLPSPVIGIVAKLAKRNEFKIRHG